MKSILLKATLPAIIGVSGLTLFLGDNLPIRAPIPKDAQKQRPWAELLLGKWKEAEFYLDGKKQTIRGESILEFTADGNWCHISTHNHPQVLQGRYRLVEKSLIDPDNPTGVSYECGEYTTVTISIDSLSDKELVLIETHRSQFTLEMAETLASSNRTVEQIMAQVRVGVQKRVWIRPSDNQ